MIPIAAPHSFTEKLDNKLSGLKVLVVEDDPLIALDVSMSLQDAGANVLGPYPTTHSALDAIPALIELTGLDLAVLDVELGSETSEPVARALTTAGIPILFHTGLDWRLGCAFSGIEASVLQKPSTPQQLVNSAAQSCFAAR